MKQTDALASALWIFNKRSIRRPPNNTVRILSILNLLLCRKQTITHLSLPQHPSPLRRRLLQRGSLPERGRGGRARAAAPRWHAAIARPDRHPRWSRRCRQASLIHTRVVSVTTKGAFSRATGRDSIRQHDRHHVGAAARRGAGGGRRAARAEHAGQERGQGVSTAGRPQRARASRARQTGVVPASSRLH